MRLNLGVLDLVALVRDLRRACLGMRVNQIYDIDNKTLLLKMQESGRKVPVLIESGVRMHTTRFDVQRRATRGGFCMKLRKHLKGRRLTGIRQLSADRVVDWRFGSGSNELHLIVEFYAGGNVILADADLNMLAVLRIYQYDSGARVAPGHKYPLREAARALFEDDADTAQDEEEDHAIAASQTTGSNAVFNFLEVDEAMVPRLQEALQAALARPDPTRKQRNGFTLKALLLSATSGLGQFGADLVHHAVLGAGWHMDAVLSVGAAAGAGGVPDPSDLPALLLFIQECRKLGALLKSVQDADVSGSAGFLLVEPLGAAEGEAVPPAPQWLRVVGSAAEQRKAQAAAAAAADDDDDESNTSPGAGSVEAGLAAVEAAPAPVPFDEAWRVLGATPLLLRQHDAVQYVTAPSYSQAYDEAAARYQQARQSRAQEAAVAAAEAKVHSARHGVQDKVQSLREAQDGAAHAAAAVEGSLDLVKDVLRVVGGARDSGMAWGHLQRLVAAQQRSGNAAALAIQGMQLEKGTISVALPDPYWQPGEEGAESDGEESDSDDGSLAGSDGDSDQFSGHQSGPLMRDVRKLLAARALFCGEGDLPVQAEEDVIAHYQAVAAAAAAAVEAGVAHDAQAAPTVPVTLRLDLSAAANAREQWSMRKTAREHEDKAMAAGARVVELAEAKVLATAKRVARSGGNSKAHTVLEARRVPFFEKFRWFISSEGVLVLAGRDAHQNELLVKRYLRPQDAYVHADTHGAASCIVRNPSNAPAAASMLPTLALTLNQAATYSAALSSNWKGALTCSAWWVYANQVSKTAPSGEFLPTGSFMIRGTKNTLHASRLELGVCLLFKVDVEDLVKRGSERTPRAGPEWQACLNDGELGEAATGGPTEPQPHSAAGDESHDSSIVKAGSFIRQPADRGARGGAAASVPAAAAAAPPAAKPKGTKGTAKRGQRGRAKKAKKKYGEQDDEERALALAAIGHAPLPLQPGAGAAGTDSPHSDTESTGSREEDHTPIASASVVPLAAVAAGLGGVGGQYTASDAGGKAWLKQERITVADEEEDEVLGVAQSAMVSGFMMRDEFLEVARFVPSLGRGDSSTMSVVMLAPWAAIKASCPFKVRITPGTLKAGKAMKQCIPIFHSQLIEWKPVVPEGGGSAGGDDAASVTTAGTRDTMAGGGSKVGMRCMALARLIPEQELTRVMIGDVKVVPPASASAAVRKAARTASKKGAKMPKAKKR